MLHLGNGLADCHQIQYVFRDDVAMHITQVIGGLNLHVRRFANADVLLFFGSREPLDGLR